MRSFIAIDISAEIKNALAVLQNELRNAGADVSWTQPENIHLTMKFLGEIDKDVAHRVEESCLRAAEQFQSFTLHLDGTGVFPNPRHPRVFWVGLKGQTDRLEALQEHLDGLLTTIGFEPEEKDFLPHLTLGRIRSNKNIRELLGFASKYQLPELSFTVNELILMKSDLHPTGARYSVLSKAPMRTP